MKRIECPEKLGTLKKGKRRGKAGNLWIPDAEPSVEQESVHLNPSNVGFEQAHRFRKYLGKASKRLLMDINAISVLLK